MSVVFIKRQWVLAAVLVVALLYLGYDFFLAPVASSMVTADRAVDTPRQQRNPAHHAHNATHSKQGYQVLSAGIRAKPMVQSFMAQDPGRIQVVDFFSYACYGCMRWRPFLEPWLKKHEKELVAYHMPILFNEQWAPFARAYFVVKQLHKNDSLDGPLFKALHEDGIDLAERSKMVDFFEAHGVPRQTFESLYDSFSVNQEMLKAKNIAEVYEIAASPSLVINTPQASYLITPDHVHGSGAALITALDALLAQSVQP